MSELFQKFKRLLALEPTPENINQRFYFDLEGTTQLMRLIGDKDITVEKVQKLLDMGADLNVHDFNGNTVLMYVIKSDLPSFFTSKKKLPDELRYELMKLLLENGADPNKMCSMRLTPLLALMNEGQTTLRDVRLLLDLGADPNAANTQNKITPIMLAASNYCHYGLYNLFLEYGADPHIKNNKGLSAFGIAMCKENIREHLLDDLMKQRRESKE